MNPDHRRRLFWIALALVVVGCGAAARKGPVAENSGAGAVAIPGATAAGDAAPAPDSSSPRAAPSSSALAAPPARTNRGSGPEGCFTNEELATRQAQAKTDNAAAYAEALRRLGLQPVHLASHKLLDGTGQLQGRFPPAHVEERDIPQHGRARVIVMPPTGGCGDLSTAFQFARGDNRVWLLERHVQSRTIDVALCGCPGCTCPAPHYSGCGGARVAATTILGYELPAGTRFAGEREVAYIEDFVRVLKALPPQPVCTPVPPPP